MLPAFHALASAGCLLPCQKGDSDFCATLLHCKDRKFLWNTDCCSVETTSGHPGGASSSSAAERDKKLLHIVHMAAEMAPIAKVRLRRHR